MLSDITCTGWLCLWSLPGDPVLRLAVWVALGLGLVTLLLMLQVMLLAELALRRERRRTRFNALWRPYLARCSLEPQATDERLPPLRRHQRLWFCLLWLRTQRQLRGAARTRLNQLLHALDIERRLVRMLRGRSVRKRLVALSCLGQLGDPGYWREVLPLLLARNPTVSLGAAQTLVAMHPGRAMAAILPLAVQRADWALPRLEGLCRQAGREAVTGPLLAALLQAGDSDHERLVDLLPLADPRHTAPWARRQLDTSALSPHLPVALACLGELADPRDHERLRRSLTQDDDLVRLSALRALRRQLRRDDEATLRHCLGDRSWWVRQEAADALVRLPGLPSERLPQLLEQTEDRYGRDALRRAMAERQS